MDAFTEITQMVLGDGASLVSKSNDSAVAKFAEGEADRKKRAMTAGLSAVGATAGAAGLTLGAHNIARGYKDQRKVKPITGRTLSRMGALKAATKNEKLATALIPLEVAGLGGEVMATKILHNDAKKPQAPKRPIAKMEPGSADVYIPTTGRLKRVAAERVTREPRKKLKKKGLEVLNETPPFRQYGVEEYGKNITWEGEISKVDTDKRQVFGWASIVEINGEPVVDLQGDYIDHDELEKSAYEYVIKSRKGGEMHRRDGDAPVHVSDMIESFIVTPEKKKALNLPDEMPTGWWVGYQINDDEAWNLVKSGKRTAFSIHGRGQRTPMED